MSIFMNKMYTTPVAMIRSFFILISTILCSLYIAFPINVFAQNGQRIGEEPSLYGSGKASSKLVFSQNIYHKHTGNKNNGGGCYKTKKTETVTEEVGCNGKMIYRPELGSTACNRCGASYYGDESDRGCWSTETVQTTKTYYELGCKKSTSSIVGYLYVTQENTEWATGIQLTASYALTAENSMKVAELPYIWNGGEAVTKSTFSVTENGSYTLQLNADANANTKEAIVYVTVRNVDATAPVIKSGITQVPEGWTKDGVSIHFEGADDLQSDGSAGCGMHEYPYSYDGGQSWGQDTSFTYEENGIHKVFVRDALENTSSYDVVISNIDRTPPELVDVEYDDTRNVKNTVLQIYANDLQPDGNNGCGLHEMPYSFDGGVTWGKDNTLQVDQNGTVTVAVRDMLENMICREVHITNIDVYAPVVTYEIKPDSWTNQEVEVHLSARDINADGSEGIGMADSWYSLDEGKTWSNESVLFFEDNRVISVLARDRYDNCSHTDISIRQIDKELPIVSLEMETVGQGADKQVILTACAEDGYSGLPEEAYSWDEGVSYGMERTKAVTENGEYRVWIRDKAGNQNNSTIMVDIFQEEENEPEKEEPASVTEPLRIMPVEETTQEEVIEESVESAEPKRETQEEESVPEEESVAEQESVEDNPQEVVVVAGKVKEEPKKQVVTPVTEESRRATEWVLFLILLILVISVILLLLCVLLRTVTVFAEDEAGNMNFIGVRLIRRKEERYEILFPELLLEQCVTTHFLLRPGTLFVIFHKKEQISCLFPEDICIVLPVAKEMDFSLL